MARKGDLRIDTDVVSTKALNMYSLSYRFESLLKSDLSAFEELDVVWKGKQHDDFMKEFKWMCDQLILESRWFHEFLVTQRNASEWYVEMENQVADVVDAGRRTISERGTKG